MLNFIRATRPKTPYLLGFLLAAAASWSMQATASDRFGYYIDSHGNASFQWIANAYDGHRDRHRAHGEPGWCGHQYG